MRAGAAARASSRGGIGHQGCPLRAEVLGALGGVDGAVAAGLREVDVIIERGAVFMLFRRRVDRAVEVRDGGVKLPQRRPQQLHCSL